MSSILLSTGLFLLQVVIPFTLIASTYIVVFRRIKASLRFAASARTETVNATKRLKKVTKVAAITTFVLAVCWLPSSIYFFTSLVVYEREAISNWFEITLGL